MSSALQRWATHLPALPPLTCSCTLLKMHATAFSVKPCCDGGAGWVVPERLQNTLETGMASPSAVVACMLLQQPNRHTFALRDFNNVHLL
jgi:hypothetical protein